MKWFSKKALKLEGDKLNEAINDLRDKLDTTADKLNEALDEAREAVDIAEGIGGEVDRVVAGQLEGYLIGHVNDFANDESQTGSVPGLLEFLDDESQWKEEDEEEEEKSEEVE